MEILHLPLALNSRTAQAARLAMAAAGKLTMMKEVIV